METKHFARRWPTAYVSRSGPAADLKVAPEIIAATPKRLRVALLSEYPLAEGGTREGGIQSVAYALAHALAQRDDVECHVICSAAGVTERYRRVGALHVHYLPRPPLPRLLTDQLYDVPQLLGAIRRIDPDVVHGQAQDRHGLAAVRSERPNLVTPHGVAFIEAELKKGIVGRIAARLMVRNEREIFQRASDMVIISRYLPEVYGALLTARTHFIENPIDPAFFDLDRQPVPTRLLFVGVVVPRKRVLDIVRAFAQLLQLQSAAGDKQRSWQPHELELRIVGPLWDSDYEARVRESISQCGIVGQVTITGALSQEQLSHEFRTAGMLLLASQEETAPQVIAQSMACGLPVVASRAGGVPFMVEHERTAMLFDPGDIKAFVHQMTRLLDEPELVSQMSGYVRQEARRRFHPESVAAQTAAVYRQVATAGGSKK